MKTSGTYSGQPVTARGHTPNKTSKSSKKSSKTLSHREDEIIGLILEDHKPLKKLIKVLKDGDVKIKEKRPAFEEFAPTLLRHAKAEEKSLYVYLKEKKELKTEGLEGDTEHALAEQLIDEAKQATRNEDLWMAKVKVLAELVEHHIEEEEDEMLKEVKKEFDLETRTQIGEEYTQLLGENPEHEANGALYGKTHEVLKNLHGKVGMPILLYFIGVPGIICVLLWLFVFRGN